MQKIKVTEIAKPKELISNACCVDLRMLSRFCKSLASALVVEIITTGLYSRKARATCAF